PRLLAPGQGQDARVRQRVLRPDEEPVPGMRLGRGPGVRAREAPARGILVRGFLSHRGLPGHRGAQAPRGVVARLTPGAKGDFDRRRRVSRKGAKEDRKGRQEEGLLLSALGGLAWRSGEGLLLAGTRVFRPGHTMRVRMTSTLCPMDVTL